MSRPPNPVDIDQLLGPHPEPPHPYGVHLTATDRASTTGVPHRLLEDGGLQRDDFIKAVAGWVANHHASAEMIARDQARREALDRLGLVDPASAFRRIPTPERATGQKSYSLNTYRRPVA